MKKNYVKKVLLGVLTFVFAAAFVSCTDYDDDIKDLQAQIDANKTSINELKTKLDAGASITSVASTSNGIKVTLSNGQSYDITNGAKGDKGDAGAGSVVTIGENGNWFIDGVDTGKPSRGEQGEQGETGEPGEGGTGTPGTPGTPGKDADIWTPNADGYWYKNGVKTDQLWLLPGVITAVVKDGILTLSNVEGYPDGFEISMNSGFLSSLQFVPEWIDNGVATQEFYYINRLALPVVAVYNSQPKMTFRYNPTSANLDNINWSFVNRTAKITRATDDKDDLLSIVSEAAIVDNALVFEVRGDATKKQAKGDKEDIAYLRANAPQNPNKPDGERMDILSDYIKIRFEALTAYIGDIVKMAVADDKKPYSKWDYSTVLNDVKALAYTANHTVSYLSNDKTKPGSYDLHDYVFASAGSGTVDRELMEKLGFADYTYKFTSEKYLGADNETDQAEFVNLDVKTGVFTIKHGTASINRTPIFKVELLAPSGDVIAVHYIKFKIVNQKVNPIAPATVVIGDVDYMDMYAASPKYKAKASMSWLQMNTDVYAKLGLSHKQFSEIYKPKDAITPEYDHTEWTLLKAGDLGTIWWSPNEPNVDTNAFGIEIDPRTQFGAHTWSITFVPNDDTIYPEVVVDFKFNLKAPAHPEFEPNYVVNNVATTKGKLIGGVYEMQTTLAESFKVPSMNNFKTKVVDVIAAHANPLWAVQEQYFAYVNGYPTASEFTARAIQTPSAAAPNGAIDQPIDYANDFITQDIRLTTPLTDDAWTYDVKLRSVYANHGVVETKWQILFENPLNVTMKPIILATEEEPSKEELAKLLNVYLGTIQVYKDGVAQGSYPTTYQVPAINAMGWTVERTSFTNTNTLFLQNATDLIWDNDGTSLANDVTTEKVKLVVATPYAIKTGYFPITLKKTVGFVGN